MLFGIFLMFSSFYQLDIHNKTRVALANLQWNIYTSRIENHIYLDLVIVIKSACLAIFEPDT